MTIVLQGTGGEAQKQLMYDEKTVVTKDNKPAKIEDVSSGQRLICVGHTNDKASSWPIASTSGRHTEPPRSRIASGWPSSRRLTARVLFQSFHQVEDPTGGAGSRRRRSCRPG